MDFSTLLKGASDSLKKLDKKTDSSTQKWQTWDGTEDDGWEDVTDVAPNAIGASTKPSPSHSASKDSDLLPSPSATAVIPFEITPTNYATPTDSANTPTTTTSASTPTTGANPISSQLETSASTPSKQTSPSVISSAATPTKQTDETDALSQKLQIALDRASTAERKVIALTRARDTRTHDASQHEILLKAMREEGEKLSVRIAEKETAVRNLRSALKDRDATLQDAEASVSATGAKLEACASRIRQLETADRAANDAREAAERRLREVEADARGKTSSSAALDAARAQLESLRKNHASALENQAMRLTAEKEAAVQLVEGKAGAREEALNKSILELRMHLSQIVDNAGWREDQGRLENDELRLRAEQLEGRNEELAAALPNATRPLIRQVEALQAAAEERERAKHAVDRSYMERLRGAEAAAATAGERERAAEDRVSEILTKCAGLEEQVRIAQIEASRTSSDVNRLQDDFTSRELEWRRDLDEALRRAERVERERETARSEVRDARSGYVDALEAAEEREKSLRSQLARAETKVAMMLERDASRRRDGDGGMASGNEGTARDSSGRIAVDDPSEDVAEEGRLVDGDGSTVAGVYATERLSSSLRLRNGEVASLQAQLGGKEKATRALAEEVVTLTARLEELAKEQARAPEVSKRFGELEGRHGTLLELLGEREERIGELEADLNDVKAMYKEQVTELLLRIERMSA